MLLEIVLVLVLGLPKLARLDDARDDRRAPFPALIQALFEGFGGFSLFLLQCLLRE
jgi:hypothetical protein